MTGTNVWSAVFVFCALAALALLLQPLTSMWRRYFHFATVAIETKAQPPSWTGPLVTTILAVGVYAMAVTLGWNAMVNATTSTEVRYVDPQAVEEQKAVVESQLPSPDELDQARALQKERQQTRSHEEALSAFDKAMEQEAKKIRQRSLADPAAQSR